MAANMSATNMKPMCCVVRRSFTLASYLFHHVSPTQLYTTPSPPGAEMLQKECNISKTDQMS